MDGGWEDGGLWRTGGRGGWEDVVDDGTDNMQILIDDLYFYNFFSRSETANLFAVLF